MTFFLRCFFLVCACSLFCQSAIANEKDYSPYPQPDAGYVTDHANLLSHKEEQRLEKWLLQVETKSNVEIIVVTIKSLAEYRGAQNESIEQFSTALFDTYGVGNLPKNDGVLLVISKLDRKARIELGQHYARSRDVDANRIMQNVIVPKFKNGNYPAGITNGTEAIINEFADLRVSFPWNIVGIAFAGFCCLLIGISYLRNGKRGWGYVFIGLAIILFLLALKLLQSMDRGSGSTGLGRAGGFGGFGGGSSGGGGSTGSW